MSFNYRQAVSEDVLMHPKRKVRYCVRIRWAVIGGRMEPVELQIGTVQPNEPAIAPDTEKKRDRLPPFWEADQPVMLSDLRDIGLQDLIDAARVEGAKPYRDYIAAHGRLPQLPGPGPHEPGEVEGWTLEAIRAHDAQPFVEKARRGPDVSPDEYQDVADVYQQAFVAGVNPREAVAKHFGISPDAAAKRVQRARERGYLPKTGRGRARIVPPARTTRRKKP